MKLQSVDPSQSSSPMKPTNNVAHCTARRERRKQVRKHREERKKKKVKRGEGKNCVGGFLSWLWVVREVLSFMCVYRYTHLWNMVCELKLMLHSNLLLPQHINGSTRPFTGNVRDLWLMGNDRNRLRWSFFTKQDRRTNAVKEIRRPDVLCVLLFIHLKHTLKMQPHSI